MRRIDEIFIQVFKNFEIVETQKDGESYLEIWENTKSPNDKLIKQGVSKQRLLKLIQEYQALLLDDMLKK